MATKQKKHVRTKGRKTSSILRSIPDALPGAKPTIGDLKDALSGRSYGILLLVLALPNLIPLPTPGLSTILGIPLVLVTFQMMLGKNTPWLPNFLTKRELNRAQLEKICDRATRTMEKIEYVIKPRLKFMVQPPADRVVAFLCLILSCLIMMPVPFGNALPAFTICLFALGILQLDGLLILVGVVMTAVSLAVISAFLGGIGASIDALFDLIG